jgi:hypothetical protein
MKQRALKCLVLASTLALFNCDDSVSDAIEQATADQPGLPTDLTGVSSSGMTDPTIDVSSSSVFIGGGPGGDVVNPTSSEATTPTSSATALNPASNSVVAPASSETVTPASSSSGTVAVASSSSNAVTSSATEVSSSSEAKLAGGVFLAEGTDENKDQMEVEYIERTGHDGGGILSYPKRLSADKKHAVVVWGPGGGTEPGAYGGMIRRLASHGFVVIALRESPGNTSQGKPALDWLEKKNKDPNDPLYQKLDMTKVGCSGHSMGGLESEQMVIQDKRVITAMLNNSGDLGHTAMASVPTDKTIGIVYGEAGMERPNAEADYNNNGVRAPACLIQMTGGPQGGEGGWGHGSGPWGGMAATVAWMRWHLGGEDFRKDDFVGSSGRYINGEIIGEQGHWKGTCKNF